MFSAPYVEQPPPAPAAACSQPQHSDAVRCAPRQSLCTWDTVICNSANRREEKLPSELNPGGGTKYSFLLIPWGNFGRYKKKPKPYFCQLSLFAFILSKYPTLEILLNVFNFSLAFIALVQSFLQTAIWWVSDQFILTCIVIAYSN